MNFVFSRRVAPVRKRLGGRRAGAGAFLLGQSWVPVGSEAPRSAAAAPALPGARAPPGGRIPEGARLQRDSGDPLPATLGAPAPGTHPVKYESRRPGTDLAQLPQLLCPLAPRPALRASSRGAVPASEQAAPSPARGAAPAFPPPGRLGGGLAGPGVGAAERPPRPAALASEPQTRREGEELVIASRGTMPTFEPLTTEQTTLGLSLHSKQVY